MQKWGSGKARSPYHFPLCAKWPLHFSALETHHIRLTPETDFPVLKDCMPLHIMCSLGLDMENILGLFRDTFSHLMWSLEKQTALLILLFIICVSTNRIVGSRTLSPFCISPGVQIPPVSLLSIWIYSIWVKCASHNFNDFFSFAQMIWQSCSLASPN